MTGGASAGAGNDDGASVATTDYGDMLDTLDAAIEEAQRKVESGRVYDAENEGPNQVDPGTRLYRERPSAGGERPGPGGTRRGDRTAQVTTTGRQYRWTRDRRGR